MVTRGHQMSDTDLLGDKPTPARGKHYIVPRGYVTSPGSGPKGHTCGDCKHIRRFRRFRKCGLAMSAWSSTARTDILARSPACAKWEAGT